VNQASPDLVGRIVLGRYRVVRAIGRGGMGVIYLARTEGAAGFVKPFVIKQAAPETVGGGDLMMAQLGREARIMSNLRHPGIVSVIDFAEENGSHLLVLDYVQGYNLGQWRRFVQQGGRDFPTELALHVVERVLDALDYAHGLTRSDGALLGIVHRDISPGNVLLDVDGHVKLADFGVARMSSDRTESSDGHMIKGKISYMAPELFAQAPPTPSSDVYACAVMLHELLVGRNEFKADTVPTTAIRVMQHVPSDVSTLRADVSPELDRVLRRALAKSPLERFSNAREFADALNRLRTIAPEQAARQLAIAVKRDFNDPRMAALLGVDDPISLERAWRDMAAAGEGPTMPLVLPTEDPNVPVELEDLAPAPAVAMIPSVPTVAAAPVALAAKDARVARSPAANPWSIALGLGGLVVAACALVLVLRSQRQTQEPERVIVVDSRASGATASSGADPAVDPPSIGAPSIGAPSTTTQSASSLPAAIAAGSARPAAEATGPREASAQSLSLALARRQDQIAKCFATPGTDVSGTAGLSVRFEVDTAGHVVSAHVLPAALSGTPLGQCIETVAKGTDFGPQPHPVTFRIPMTARRSP
jgi:eukaryotic-like serine/threonine-protein kinase